MARPPISYRREPTRSIIDTTDSPPVQVDVGDYMAYLREGRDKAHLRIDELERALRVVVNAQSVPRGIRTRVEAALNSTAIDLTVEFNDP